MSSVKVFYFLKQSYGGSNKFIEIFKKLKNKKLKTYVYCFEKNFPVNKQIKYLSDNLTSNFPSIYKLLLFIKNIFTAKKLIEKSRPRLIIAGDNYSLVLLSLLKPFFSYKAKLILRIGNNLTQLINSKPFIIYRKILFYLVKLAIKHVDYFICQSKEGLLDFKINFSPNDKAKLKIIYNGINIKKAKKLSKKKFNKIERSLFEKNLIKIISVGRLSHQKDFFTLIKAFKIVHNKIPFSRLIIIGDGNLKLEIQQFIKKNTLGNSIFLLGWKQNVFPYLKHANLFVFSSKYEGFPFSLLEAMSQKLPIISTDTKFGPKEILDNGRYGVLVPVGDYRQMANKIIHLLNNKSQMLNLSNLSYQRVKYFSELKMIINYRSFLLEICKSL